MKLTTKLFWRVALLGVFFIFMLDRFQEGDAGIACTHGFIAGYWLAKVKDSLVEIAQAKKAEAAKTDA